MSPGLTLALQALIGIVPVVVAYVTVRGGIAANRAQAQANRAQTEETRRLELEKVDREVWARASALYEKAIAQVERQADRMQHQMELLSTELADTKDRSTATSHRLQNRVDLMTNEIEQMRFVIDTLYQQLVDAGLTPAFDASQILRRRRRQAGDATEQESAP